MDYNVDNIESKPEIQPSANTDLILHKDGKFQRAKIFGTNGKIKSAFVEAVVNNIITNNTYNLDPQQIVPSEALYTDDTLAGDIIKRVDKTTGENVNYRQTTHWIDGTQMTDNNVDGVLYIKKDDNYYVRNNKYLNVLWFKQSDDADDTLMFKRATQLMFKTKQYGINTLYVPSGKYAISDQIDFPAECTLYGIFKNEVIITQTDRTKHAFYVKEKNDGSNNDRSTTTDTEFKNLTIRGTLALSNAFTWKDKDAILANNTNCGICFESLIRSNIEDVTIEGFETAGIWYHNSYYHKFSGVLSRLNKFGLWATGVCTSIFGSKSEFRLNAQGHRIEQSYSCRFSRILFESNHNHYLYVINFDNWNVARSGVGVFLRDCVNNVYDNCYFEAQHVQIFLQDSNKNSFKTNFISAGTPSSIYPDSNADGHSGILMNSSENEFIGNDHYTYIEEKAKYYIHTNSKNNLFTFKSKEEFYNFIEKSNLNHFTIKSDAPIAKCQNINKMYVNGKITFINNSNSGTTSERPDLSSVNNGFQYYDTDIKKILYADKTNNNWLDAIGNIVV